MVGTLIIRQVWASNSSSSVTTGKFLLRQKLLPMENLGGKEIACVKTGLGLS